MLTRYGSDPIVVDATISGLRGSEADVLERVLQANAAFGRGRRGDDARRGDGKSGDVARRADDRRARGRCARCRPGSAAAVLQGLDTGAAGRGRRRRPGRARRAVARRQPVRSSRCRPSRRTLKRAGGADDDDRSHGEERRRQARLAGQAGAGRRGRVR